MSNKQALNRLESIFPLNREYKSNYYANFIKSVEPFYKDFDLVMGDLEKLDNLQEKQEILIRTINERVQLAKEDIKRLEFKSQDMFNPSDRKYLEDEVKRLEGQIGAYLDVLDIINAYD